MALVVARKTSDQPEYKAWLFRTRPLLVPGVALTVWITYAFRFFPILRSGFWGNVRWSLLVLLVIQGALEIWKWGGDTPLPLPVIGFFLFSLAAFASATYSLIPLLSFYKAIAFAFGLIGLVFGIGLRHRGRPDSWLRLLATLNLVIVGLSVLLFPSFGSYDSGLLQGPFVNPNSLGSCLALTVPALLWLRERHRRDTPLLLRSKLLTWAVLAELLILFFSRSRASLLALVLVLVLFAFFRGSRFAWAVVYGMIVLLLLAPAVASQVGREAVFKGRDAQLSIVIRVDQFHDTLTAAESNLIGGYGFGMSKGTTQWDGSLSASAVGREKSNAYLGTIEEVGLVGGIPLILGVIGTLAMGLSAARSARGTPNATPAALFAIIAAGALHTNFEAWLTAMGSFEAFLFWSTMGVLLMNLQDVFGAPSSGRG